MKQVNTRLNMVNENIFGTEFTPRPPPWRVRLESNPVPELEPPIQGRAIVTSECRSGSSRSSVGIGNHHQSPIEAAHQISRVSRKSRCNQRPPVCRAISSQSAWDVRPPKCQIQDRADEMPRGMVLDHAPIGSAGKRTSGSPYGTGDLRPGGYELPTGGLSE